MQKVVDFEQICDLYIQEDKSVDVDALLTEWFVAAGKDVYESLMCEDDANARLDIENDQNEIEGEEFFGEDELETGDEDEGVEAASDELDSTMSDGEEGEELTLSDLAKDFEDLKAEFDKLLANEVSEPEHEDLEADIGRDIDGDGEISGDTEIETDDEEGGEPVASDDTDTDVEEEFNIDEFLDLEESFQLEPVGNPKVAGNKEIGDGGTISVNDVSPIPQKKTTERAFQGKPVAVTSTQHKGYDKETAPAVKQSKLLKNQVGKAMDDLETVSKEGSKSALLNSGEGFGSDSPKSPIGGGATDLRGKGKA